ncbi:MAG: response regulator [Pseudomonadales bacterium]|nr:response regulator [Pseudomonadales bacterium]
MSRLKNNNNDTVAYLTPADVAKRMLVSPITVNQWAKKGWLKSTRTGGGHHRFLPEDLEAFCRERNIEMPDLDQPLKILIIDNDVQHCDLLVRLFNKLPINIQTSVAHDGFDAGRMVERFSPHLVLLDFTLPGINIYKLCERLNEEVDGHKMRIVAMSQFISDGGEEKIIQAVISQAHRYGGVEYAIDGGK